MAASTAPPAGSNVRRLITSYDDGDGYETWSDKSLTYIIHTPDGVGDFKRIERILARLAFRNPLHTRISIEVGMSVRAADGTTRNFLPSYNSNIFSTTRYSYSQGRFFEQENLMDAAEIKAKSFLSQSSDFFNGINMILIRMIVV